MSVNVMERPVRLKDIEARAILAGHKTVLRRAVSPPPELHHWHRMPGYELRPSVLSLMACGRMGVRFKHTIPGNPQPELEPWVMCPYGRPGTRLWVRETFAGPLVNEEQMHLVEANGWDSFRKPEFCQYRASGGSADFFDYAKDETVCRWTPNIHMPRWASRILLEVTDVRVERLQDISVEQAKGEGVRLYTDHAELGDWWHVEGIETYSADPRKSFELLWSSINIADSWPANPWVWVIEFQRVLP